MIRNRLGQEILMLGIALMLVLFIPTATAENAVSKHKPYATFNEKGELVHNLVHLFTGLGILVAIIKYQGYDGRILKIVGTAYVVVTIEGFLTSGDTLLGITHINEADRCLHHGLAIVILGAGFLQANSRTRLNNDAMAS